MSDYATRLEQVEKRLEAIEKDLKTILYHIEDLNRMASNNTTVLADLYMENH